jgi:hypothetical protein
MHVHLQGQGKWEVVEHGRGDYDDDCEALGAILCTKPPETTANEAWDAIKALKLGSECVRDARVETCRSKFDNTVQGWREVGVVHDTPHRYHALPIGHLRWRNRA